MGKDSSEFLYSKLIQTILDDTHVNEKEHVQSLLSDLRADLNEKLEIRVVL